MITNFNKPSNTTSVFLLSTKAGNMGINLMAANRVVLMDTSWNPANDLQAMFRYVTQARPAQPARRMLLLGLFFGRPVPRRC